MGEDCVELLDRGGAVAECRKGVSHDDVDSLVSLEVLEGVLVVGNCIGNDSDVNIHQG